MATPQEVAEFLVNENKRPLWELNLKSISKVSSSPHTIELQYQNSQTKYEVVYEMQRLTQKEGSSSSFLIVEKVLFNKGQQSQTRLYLLEEVQNRPYFLRLSLYFKASSEFESRTMLLQMNSLRNSLMA